MNPERIVDFRYAPAARWTAICRPDDPYKTLVNEKGALLYGFSRRFMQLGEFRFDRVISFAIHTDQQPVAIAQQTETARIPVVVTKIQYPKATLTLRAFGHQHDGGRRTDVVLWSVETTPGVEEFLTAFWVQVQALDRQFVPAASGSGHSIFAVVTGEAPTGQWAADLSDQFQSGEVCERQDVPDSLAFVSRPHPLRVFSAFDHGPASGLLTPLTLVRPGHPLEGALLLPQNHGHVAELDEGWARQALEDERRFWNGYDLQPLTMEIPDPGIMEMVTACARNILQAREVKDGIPEFQVGPTVYRGLWVVDGHFLLEAAQYLGHREAAFQGIDALLRRVRPSGAIYQMEHHTKETGIALATLVRQCELANRLDRLQELWPVVRNAVHYIGQMREASKKRGPEAPEYGLMPPSFGDGGLGGTRPEYTTALWTLVGLKEATRAAGLLGYDEDAGHFQAAYEDLMQAFRSHAERDLQRLPDGTPYLPMLKPGSGEHHRIPDYAGEPLPWERVNPGTATWALAQAIYPGEIFAPDDPLVQNFCHLLDLIDDEEGIPAESGWLPYKAVWNYAASFYAHVWLYVGRPDKAVDYLYAFANHAAPTRVWREEQSFRDSHHGQKVGDMPHNWASAEFIRLVRNLLVFERGNMLELLPSLPPEWLLPGRTLSLVTPTRFGIVRLRLDVDAHRNGVLAIETEGSWWIRPERCLLHVPSHPGFRLQSATFNGRGMNAALGGGLDLLTL